MTDLSSMGLLSFVPYILANFIIALMVGCMLFSAYVHSTHRFRSALGLLAVFSLGNVFYAIELTIDVLAHRHEFGELAPLAFSQVMQSVVLAVVLVAIRRKQIAARLHLHPRQRECARPAGVAGELAQR